LHWVFEDIVPPSLAEAMKTESEQESQQRLRLLYVACTRAMELLVLPDLSWTDDAAWMRAIDFKLQDVPELDISKFIKKPYERPTENPNMQTPEVFESERSRIDKAFPVIRWIRPSDGDRDLVQFQSAPAVAWEQPIEPTTPVQGSSLRGIILHKLMEEFLTGELDVSPETAERRSLGLIRELVPADTPTPQLDVQELAATALRTIALKELSDDRDNVIAEVPVYGSIGAVDRLIAGRADAVRYRNGDAEIVFDWKSDVDPKADDRATYAHQLAQYVHVLRAKRGAIVYMTTGEIQWVEPAWASPTQELLGFGEIRSWIPGLGIRAQHFRKAGDQRCASVGRKLVEILLPPFHRRQVRLSPERLRGVIIAEAELGACARSSCAGSR
jgi:CRISPR-associated exonuclease Cas4